MIYLSSNLRVLRNREKLTQKATADKLGLGVKTYGNYEGKIARQPSNLVLIRMGEMFGVAINDLVLTDLSKTEPKVIRENLILTRYNLTSGVVRQTIDSLLKIK